MMDNKQRGRVLGAVVAASGKTQATVAKAAGINQSYLSLLLRGRRALNQNVWDKVLGGLGTSLSYHCVEYEVGTAVYDVACDIRRK